MEIFCPNCKGSNIVRKGKRKVKFDEKQMYYCKDCCKAFVDRGFKGKKYPEKAILDAVSTYNLGYTLEETAKAINRKFKINATKSSVQRWVKELKGMCTYSKFRGTVAKMYGTDTIVSKEFKRRGLSYNFRYHKGKSRLLGGEFPSLISYIKKQFKLYTNRLEARGPDFFDSIEKKCSQIKIEVNVEKKACQNDASRLAALALKVRPEVRERHSAVENFMLINDDSTVACEVSVWLWEKNIRANIAGHIDLIQIKNGLVYILDFKPVAARENDSKVASQLYLYASGLSFRTSIPLDKFRCAWFDDKDYFEFEPRKAGVRYKIKDAAKIA